MPSNNVALLLRAREYGFYHSTKRHKENCLKTRKALLPAWERRLTEIENNHNKKKLRLSYKTCKQVEDYQTDFLAKYKEDYPKTSNYCPFSRRFTTRSKDASRPWEEDELERMIRQAFSLSEKREFEFILKNRRFANSFVLYNGSSFELQPDLNYRSLLENLYEDYYDDYNDEDYYNYSCKYAFPTIVQQKQPHRTLVTFAPGWKPFDLFETMSELVFKFFLSRICQAKDIDDDISICTCCFRNLHVHSVMIVKQKYGREELVEKIAININICNFDFTKPWIRRKVKVKIEHGTESDNDDNLIVSDSGEDVDDGYFQ